MTTAEHGWLPRTSCTEGCVQSGIGEPGHRVLAAVRSARRIALTLILLMGVPALAIPLPGHRHLKRIYCRTVLRSLGVRMTVSGGPIRNLPGQLVVSNHVSWVDVFAIGAVMPGSFVARADLITWPALGIAARLAGVIPIERRSLRTLPAVVSTVVQRIGDGHTVVAFPEGTTFCGRDNGTFRPAMFQAAIDANRPVQPVRVSYRHRDGTPSTVTAFFGEHSLWESIRRTVRARRTVVHLDVRPLELPIPDRGEFAARCQRSVFGRSAAAGHSAEAGCSAGPTLSPGEQLRYSSNVAG